MVSRAGSALALHVACVVALGAALALPHWFEVEGERGESLHVGMWRVGGSHRWEGVCTSESDNAQEPLFCPTLKAMRALLITGMFATAAEAALSLKHRCRGGAPRVSEAMLGAVAAAWLTAGLALLPGMVEDLGDAGFRRVRLGVSAALAIGAGALAWAAALVHVARVAWPTAAEAELAAAAPPYTVVMLAPDGGQRRQRRQRRHKYAPPPAPPAQ